MQTLFDLPMSSSLSYLIALIVILGLLAIFAVIVRRVAADGLRTEGGRGRGPRLGVVDTYALDRTRQLVIIRRDDVEHLLMVGGTNDVLIEANIVRALPASAIREQQVSLVSQANLAAQLAYDDAPMAQSNYDERNYAPAFNAPVQPQPPQAPQAQTPRLKVSSAANPPQAPAPRGHVESEMAFAPQISQQQYFDPYDASPSPTQQAREALNNSELQALAKRLEASIPPLQPKVEKPVAQQQVSLAVEPKLTPQAAPMPIAPPPMQPSAQQQVQQPSPPVISAPPMAIPVAPPAAAPVQAPIMPQPRAPIMPQAMQMPSPPKPVMPQAAPQPVQQPILQQSPSPVAPPPQPEAPKDKQAAALDENLRRLLGRKLDPR